MPSGGSCLLGSINLSEFVTDNNIFNFDDCEIFDEEESLSQKELSDLLFEKTGILVADAKGGENKIE